jgi:hypothetical protein
MTKKDDKPNDEPEVVETPEPPADPGKKPTAENLEQWQEHANKLEAQIAQLAADLKEARAEKTPPADLKPLETALAEVKRQQAETAEVLAKIQKALEERPPSKNEPEGRPAPKPEQKAKPLRSRSGWV